MEEDFNQIKIVFFPYFYKVGMGIDSLVLSKHRYWSFLLFYFSSSLKAIYTYICLFSKINFKLTKINYVNPHP